MNAGGHGKGRNRATVTDRRYSPFVNWLTGPVEALPLRVFEIWVAVTFPLRLTRNMPFTEWLTAEGYHVTPEQWRALGYPEAFPLLPAWGVWVYLGLILLAVAGLAADLRRRRLWLGILLGCVVYAQGVDYMAATSANKQYIALFFILFTGPGLWRCPETGRWMVSAATLRALQGTILVIYFAAGWSKGISGDWLKFSDVLYTQVQGSHRTEIAAWALRTWPLWFWNLNQHLALFFELGAPLLLGVRRLRPVGFILGIGMHVVIALTMFQLIYFSLLMWAYYALFVSAEQWRVLAGLPRRLHAEGLSAVRDTARRFWEEWVPPRSQSGLATRSGSGGRWRQRPALVLSVLLFLWLLPFYWMGLRAAADSKKARVVRAPEAPAANERIRAARALLGQELSRPRALPERPTTLAQRTADTHVTSEVLEEGGSVPVDTRQGSPSAGKDAREPGTGRDASAPAKASRTWSRPPVPPPMRVPGGAPLDQKE